MPLIVTFDGSEKPVAAFSIVTLAPATTAPLASEIVPRSEVVAD